MNRAGDRRAAVSYDGKRSVIGDVATGEAGRARRPVENVDRQGMVAMDEKDDLAATGEIAFKQTAMAFFRKPRCCESEQQAEEHQESIEI